MKHLIRPALAGLFLTFALPALALTPTEVAKLTASDGAPSDLFGISVAVDGNTAVIGARLDDDNGSSSGSAYVFVRDGTGNWTEQAKLTASDGAEFDEFGSSVAVDGHTAVIGAGFDDDNGTNSGSAYVFVGDGSGNWTEQAKLTASDGTWGKFGRSVAVDGNTAVIGGTFFDDDKGFESGSAYVFVRDGSGHWTEQAKLTASDGAAFDLFGESVAIDGSTAVIGARGVNDKGSNSGSAYVFVRDGTGNWTEQAKLTASDGAEFDEFGSSVAVDGHTAVIGAGFDDDNGTNSGSAYVFVRDGSGNWTEQAKLTASDGASVDVFGFSVAVDGNTAVIGASLDDDNGSFSGSAYVFVRDGTGNWSEQAKLTASDAAAGDGFGESVAVDGNTAVIGAVLDDDKGSNSGSAYVFSLEAPSDVDGDGTPDLSDPCPADPLDECDPTGSTAEVVSSTDGGTVTTPDGNVTIDVEPGDLPEGSTTISVTETFFTDPEVDLSIGATAGAGQAVSFYDIEPDGLDFSPNTVELTLRANVTGLNPAQRNKLDIYRLEPDGSGGFAFVPLGATCSVVEDPVDTFTATCVVALDHFSTYGLIAPLDSDGDGIFDDFDGESDQCPAEDASGFDVDKDGCIDSIGGLSEMVSGLVEEGVIDEKMETSLLSKVDNAESSSTRDNICTAVNQLESFISHVQAQTGKKISEQSAADVIEYANSVIAHLEAGVSC